MLYNLITSVCFTSTLTTVYRSTIGAVVDENDTIVTSDSDKANMFNVYYTSAGVVDDGILPPCPNVAVKSTIENIRFDISEIV